MTCACRVNSAPQHLPFRPSLMSQCTVLMTHLVREQGERTAGQRAASSRHDFPSVCLLSSQLSCQVLPSKLWQLTAKCEDLISGLAMNECSVWDQSTRWMLFRFGSVHRKHSVADTAPGGLLAYTRQLGQPAKAH